MPPITLSSKTEKLALVGGAVLVFVIICSLLVLVLPKFGGFGSGDKAKPTFAELNLAGRMNGQEVKADLERQKEAEVFIKKMLEKSIENSGQDGSSGNTFDDDGAKLVAKVFNPQKIRENLWLLSVPNTYGNYAFSNYISGIGNSSKIENQLDSFRSGLNIESDPRLQYKNEVEVLVRTDDSLQKFELLVLQGDYFGVGGNGDEGIFIKPKANFVSGGQPVFEVVKVNNNVSLDTFIDGNFEDRIFEKQFETVVPVPDIGYSSVFLSGQNNGQYSALEYMGSAVRGSATINPTTIYGYNKTKFGVNSGSNPLENLQNNLGNNLANNLADNFNLGGQKSEVGDIKPDFKLDFGPLLSKIMELDRPLYEDYLESSSRGKVFEGGLEKLGNLGKEIGLDNAKNLGLEAESISKLVPSNEDSGLSILPQNDAKTDVQDYGENYFEISWDWKLLGDKIVVYAHGQQSYVYYFDLQKVVSGNFEPIEVGVLQRYGIKKDFECSVQISVCFLFDTRNGMVQVLDFEGDLQTDGPKSVRTYYSDVDKIRVFRNDQNQNSIWQSIGQGSFSKISIEQNGLYFLYLDSSIQEPIQNQTGEWKWEQILRF